MQPTLAVDLLVLLAAALLAGGVLVAWLTRWVRVPGSLLFLALGMAVADDGLALVRFGDPSLARNLSDCPHRDPLRGRSDDEAR